MTAHGVLRNWTGSDEMPLSVITPLTSPSSASSATQAYVRTR